ncbi:MAG: hypothetical protein HYZ53_16150 [Planctomycetes bacterium]|nr:hypothetical protein [Planctomycetota bacterium]
MKKTPLPAGDVLTHAEGFGICGCLVLLPFLLSTWCVTAGPLWARPTGSWEVSLPIGGFVTLLLFGLGCFRWGSTLDRRARTVTSWWGGLRLPIRRTTRRLDGFTSVNLRREIKDAGQKTMKIVYPVRLAGADDSLVWTSTLPERDARRAAERLARFAQLPLLDWTSGSLVRREPEHLDESLRERVRRTREELKVPSMPPGFQEQCQFDGRRFTLETRGPGFSLYLVVVLFPYMILTVLSAFMLLWGGACWEETERQALQHRPGYNQGEARRVSYALLVLGGILSSLTVAGVRSVLIECFARGRVTAIAESLRVERRRLFGRKVVEIPAGELEELVKAMPGTDSPQGPAPRPVPGTLAAVKAKLPRVHAASASICARSDRARVDFGHNLTAEQVAFVHAALMKVLAG